MINDFNRQLLMSESDELDFFWESAYRDFFPDMVGNLKNMAGKSTSQNLGIDRIIHLSSGKSIYIDEKIRTKEYGDILIEYKSNSNNSTDDGWINKDLHIDFIAYGFKNSGKVFLLPWLPLRRAWGIYGEKWKSEYGTTVAENYSYNTYSCAVPTKVLMIAIIEAGYTKTTSI